MKRNIQLIFIIFLFLTSCKEQLKNCIETTLYTQDSLYKITFEKPIELDTCYNWLDANDNSCDDKYKYRFSKKNYPEEKESGFFKVFSSDCSYRITLSHTWKYRCKSFNIISPKDWLKAMSQKAKADNIYVPFDTLFSKTIKINGLDCATIAYKINENLKNGYWTHKLKTMFFIDSNRILLEAECRSYDCKGFIDKMEKSFQTIEIEKLK